MSSKRKFAVIGNPIDHSLSPKIHKLFAKELGQDITYEAIKVEKEVFESRVNRLFEDGYEGLNVTLPLKELAFDYADTLSEDSKACGSVNTLWKDGSKVFADTTDGRGLVRDLTEKGIDLKDKEIIILGAGGSARAIIASLLRQDPARITIGNRTRSKAEALANQFSSPTNQIKVVDLSQDLNFVPDLIVNSTSAGVLKENIEFPKNLFSKQAQVYDLSYSEFDTPFMELAMQSGTEICYDGIGMLIHQAALSFEIWTGETPSINFDKKELFVTAALKQIQKGTKIDFVIGEETFINTTEKKITKIEIDFGDGYGFRDVSIGETIKVHYQLPGKKNISTRLFFLDGSMSSRSFY